MIKEIKIKELMCCKPGMLFFVCFVDKHGEKVEFGKKIQLPDELTSREVLIDMIEVFGKSIGKTADKMADSVEERLNIIK